MRERIWAKLKRIGSSILAIVVALAMGIPAGATTIDALKELINRQQEEIDHLNENIDEWQEAQDLLQEEIDDLDAELLNTMTAIGLLEDDIVAKQEEITIAQSEYEAALNTEEEQYQAMKVRMQMMYETGNTSYLEAFLAAGGFGDMINRASNIEALYEYDQKLWKEYIAQKEFVATLKAQLEEDKRGLEADKESLSEQKEYLDDLLVEKQAASDNFEAQISRAKQEAAAYKKKIQQEQDQIKKLEEEARRKKLEEERRKAAAAAAAAKGNSSSSTGKIDASIVTSATGSQLGKEIAAYGLQFVGNPYVFGGTSLTNGADCSGFTYRIYSDFGYSIPRTSFQQRSAGTGVAYEDAQPGDLICYDGHVGLYIGNGYIVHASSQKTGIKTSKATYREILAVRRIIQ